MLDSLLIWKLVQCGESLGSSLRRGLAEMWGGAAEFRKPPFTFFHYTPPDTIDLSLVE